MDYDEKENKALLISRYGLDNKPFQQPNNAEPDDLQFERLCKGVRMKLDALTCHHFYSLYKAGSSQETRAKARQDYLSAIGLLDSFLWPPEQDVNVTHTEMDIR